jgi:ACT domain-containing protein
MSEEPSAHTVRLELVDEPGELLRALEPVAENGGNLLSVFHERGNVTPRGHIPVEVDLECPPNRFDDIVTGVRDAGVTVVRVGRERYGEQVIVILVGDVIGTDLSDTVDAIEGCETARVEDLELSAPSGDDVASVRCRLAVESGEAETALSAVRSVADRKGLSVIEPLTGVNA